MTLYVDQPRVRLTKTLEEYPSPMIDAVVASAKQAWYDSPVSQLVRQWEDHKATGTFQSADDGINVEFTPAPRVDADTARSRAQAAGVNVNIPPDGMTEGALALLIARQQEVRQRHDTMARSTGVVSGTAQFVAGLATAMLDPINLASAFIPVARPLGMVNQLRKAEFGATVGTRTLARAQIGAVEGVVGQAVLEPLTAYRMDQEQLDYELTDSLRNVAFGAILGSAFHTVLGGLADKLGAQVDRPSSLKAKLADLPPEVVEADFKANLAAAAEGRVVDTAPLRDAPAGRPEMSWDEAVWRAGFEEDPVTGRLREVDSDAVKAAYEKSMQPESDVHADFDALREVDEQVQAAATPKDTVTDIDPAIKEALADAEADLRDLQRELGVEGQKAKMEAFDEEIARATAYEKALHAAAACATR